MKAYVRSQFHFVSNAGGLSGDEIARLSDEELAEYLEASGFEEAKKVYQISPSYVLRQIGGEYAIVPVGEQCSIQNAMMTPNGSAAFLWEAFMTPSTEEDVVMKGLDRYEVPAERIREDVHRFVEETRNYGILVEVM